MRPTYDDGARADFCDGTPPDAAETPPDITLVSNKAPVETRAGWRLDLGDPARHCKRGGSMGRIEDGGAGREVALSRLLLLLLLAHSWGSDLLDN
jgi:hypothetical protein